MSNYEKYLPLKNTLKFIIKNIAPNRKSIRVFGQSIYNGQEFNLLAIPGVNESVIRSSLAKGELYNKILTGQLIVTNSDIDLIQFNEQQKEFLQNSGVTEGLEAGTPDEGGGEENELIPGGTLLGNADTTLDEEGNPILGSVVPLNAGQIQTLLQYATSAELSANLQGLFFVIQSFSGEITNLNSKLAALSSTISETTSQDVGYIRPNNFLLTPPGTGFPPILYRVVVTQYKDDEWCSHTFEFSARLNSSDIAQFGKDPDDVLTTALKESTPGAVDCSVRLVAEDFFICAETIRPDGDVWNEKWSYTKLS